MYLGNLFMCFLFVPTLDRGEKLGSAFSDKEITSELCRFWDLQHGVRPKLWVAYAIVTSQNRDSCLSRSRLEKQGVFPRDSELNCYLYCKVKHQHARCLELAALLVSCHRSYRLILHPDT